MLEKAVIQTSRIDRLKIASNGLSRINLSGRFASNAQDFTEKIIAL